MKPTTLTRPFAAVLKFLLIASWAAYLVTILWWETANHPKLFLEFGHGQGTIYRVGGLMVVLVTLFAACLSSPRSTSWRWGTSLILLVWIAFLGLVWDSEMWQQVWTEADFMGHGFGYVALFYLAVFAAALTLILAGLFRLFTPSNWRRDKRTKPEILKNRNAWLGLGIALPLLFNCFQEGPDATLLLLGTIGASICLIYILTRIRQSSRS